MFEIFQYDFMVRAFVTGILLAIVIPCIGVIIVLKRLSMIGDAFSHTSLAGVAAGLLFGFNPILGASAACVAAAFGVEGIRKKIPRYSEMSIAIIMSAGIGIAGILSGFVSNGANFNSFLFGSIVAISDFEMYLVLAVVLIVTIGFVFLLKELIFITFSEQKAKLAGIPVGVINFVFTIFTAFTVSIAARTVGALIVSSMMVIPVACSMQFAKSFKQIILFSIGFDLIFTISGLYLSYYMGLKPGATIVVLGVCILIIIFLLKSILSKLLNINN
jgi:zinc transport system permease protein